MRFRGVVMLGAGLALACGAIAACGDSTTNNTTNVIVGMEGGPDAPFEMTEDAGDGGIAVDASDAAADAPYDGPGCANDQSPTSDSCSIFGPCTADDCAAKDSILISCFKSGGGKRPPVVGCNDIGPNQDEERWCCPPACVLEKNSDGNCDATHRYVACASIDGGPMLSPGSGCTSVPLIDSPGQLGYCCPR